MLFWPLLLPPLLAALLALVVRPYRPWVGRAGVLLALVPLGAALLFAAQALAGGPAPTWGMHLGPLDLREFLRADSLSALLMLCITFVAALALWLGPGLQAESSDYDAARRCAASTSSSTSSWPPCCWRSRPTMSASCGSPWRPPPSSRRSSSRSSVSKASVEASWKYILLGSVGIALAFAGTVLAYFDFVTLAAGAEQR